MHFQFNGRTPGYAVFVRYDLLSRRAAQEFELRWRQENHSGKLTADPFTRITTVD